MAGGGGSVVLAGAVVEEAEALLGARLHDVERVARGYSRVTYRAVTDAGQKVALRLDTGDGPSSGTPLTLAREAAYYKALANSRVRIPALMGVGRDGGLIVLEWAAGTAGMSSLSPEGRNRMWLDYIDALAELHQTPVPDGTAEGLLAVGAGIVGQLNLWQQILALKATGAWPLAHFAIDLLGRVGHPRPATRCICHGDVGPGNFLHDGSRVTALLDWEFAHLGDPHDDLAWWMFRGHDMTGACGEIDQQLDRWKRATGMAVEPEALDFYRAFAALRFYIPLVITLETAGPGYDRAVPMAVLAQVSRHLPRLLAHLIDHQLPDYQPPAVGYPAAGRHALDVLRSDLTEVIAPALDDGEARRRVRGDLLLLSHLEALLASGVALEEEECADQARLLGQSVPDSASGDRSVRSLIGRPDRDGRLLDYFWRRGLRQSALWPT